MSAITRILSEFATTITDTDLPADVKERARALVLDQFGICLRARNDAAICASMRAALDGLGLGAGEATVIGDGEGYAAPAAALFNGTLGHCLDFDDTHARGSIHPSAPILSAALAAAEMTAASGRDLLAAVVAGYEVQIRLSLALGPTDHYQRGFHPTATCGVFGATAAAGRLFGLSTDQMAHAMGLCGSLAAGSMQFLVDGAWNKPFHTGYAAMNGLTAASFALHGFKGAAAAVEGRCGFLSAYAPKPEPDLAISDLGTVWETRQIAVKPYPSCRYGHAAMDALIALTREHDIDTGDIEQVEIGLPETGWRLIGDPEEEKQNPKNYVDGQFSMAFVGAVALREGRMSWDDYAKHLKDPQTLSLCRKTRAVVDPTVEAEFPAHMSGVARVRTSTDRYEKLVVVAKGEPGNFLDAEELRAKFDGLTAPFVEADVRTELADTIVDLENADVRRLMARTRPATTDEIRAAGGS